jgi:hypothetical protein
VTTKNLTAIRAAESKPDDFNKLMFRVPRQAPEAKEVQS